MKPSRKQFANGTYNPNFVMKLGMSNPWKVYFPLIEQKVGKVTAGYFLAILRANLSFTTY